MIPSDFILIRNFKNVVPGHDPVRLFTFNRSLLLGSLIDRKPFSHFFDLMNLSGITSENPCYIWGNVYLRNEHNRNGFKLLTNKDIGLRHKSEGDNFIRKCKGSFVILMCDENSIIKLFSDQLHPRSAYYYSQNDLLVVSSSLSAVIEYLKTQNIPISINHSWLLEHYLYEYSLDNSTLIRDVYETQPGQAVSFSHSDVRISQWFDVMTDLDYSGPKMTSKEGIDYLKHVFTSNVRLYDKGPDLTAVALTGGYDSRSIIASLGDNYTEYQYYSYGRPESWDVKIPQLIAQKLNLNYVPILFEKKFDDSFIENGLKGLMLSDGTGTLSLSNYVYAYANFFEDKKNIITGLFGSELIKRFTGANLAISSNMLSLLTKKSFEQILSDQLKEAAQNSFFSNRFITNSRDQTLTRLSNNTLINNELPQNQKVFLHFLALGTRKYFQKELKIQSPWVTNLHPFYDIDFIEALLKTPFPNLYNWELKKSLIKNLKTHRLYGALIDQRPELSNFMSTHGFKPKYLKSKLYSPFIALDFYRYKKTIKAASGMSYKVLIDNALNYHLCRNRVEHESLFYLMMKQADQKNPQFTRMFSVYLWLNYHGIEA